TASTTSALIEVGLNPAGASRAKSCPASRCRAIRLTHRAIAIPVRIIRCTSPSSRPPCAPGACAPGTAPPATGGSATERAGAKLMGTYHEPPQNPLQHLLDPLKTIPERQGFP